MDDSTEQSGAADALQSDPAASNTFYLPPDCGVDGKPGDTITLKIVGKDEHGLEVSPDTGDKGDDWGDDLENHMPASVGGRMEEQ